MYGPGGPPTLSIAQYPSKRKRELGGHSFPKNSIVKCNNFLLIFLYILSHHNKAVNIHSFVGSLL